MPLRVVQLRLSFTVSTIRIIDGMISTIAAAALTMQFNLLIRRQVSLNFIILAHASLLKMIQCRQKSYS